jgi:hypothetical protein
LFRLLEGVDGRDKPGQDEVIGRKIFPGQPCAFAGMRNNLLRLRDLFRARL